MSSQSFQWIIKPEDGLGAPELKIGFRSKGCLVWTVLPRTSQLTNLLKVASGYRGGVIDGGVGGWN